MPGPTSALQARTQVEHTPQEDQYLEQNNLTAVSDLVGSASVSDLLRESGRFQNNPDLRDCQMSVVETTRDLKSKIIERIREGDIDISKLDPETRRRLIGLLKDPEKQQQLRDEIESSDPEKREQACRDLEQEVMGTLEAATSDPENLDVETVHAVATTLAQDPNVPEEVAHELRQLVEKLEQEVKKLRELLEDELIREALLAYHATYDSEPEQFLYEIDGGKVYKWLVDSEGNLPEKEIFRVEEDEEFKEKLQQILARERVEERLEEAIRDNEQERAAMAYKVMLEGDPDRQLELKGRLSELHAQAKALSAHLEDVRGRMVA